MMADILSYDDFLKEAYEECKNAEWFPDLLEACHGLDTDPLTVSAIIGEIHEGLRVAFDEAVKYFWTVFLINPLIAIKAYQETDLLLDKLDLSLTFKHINPLDPYANSLRSVVSWIYNSSVENFVILSIEALLQKDMNPELLDVINRNFLGGLYDHDKHIMDGQVQNGKDRGELPPKWITHRTLYHILNAIDPHHIIVLLEFFADRYGARLYRGNVGEFCYSGDKYDYIIRFIKRRYGSLSEYILWNDNCYGYHYINYYKTSLCYNEMYANMDIIFPTMEDKEKIQRVSGISITDKTYRLRREENHAKNPRRR